jgi:hypothetical protein
MARAVADLDLDGQGRGLEGEECGRFGGGADGPALVRKETEPILRRERKNSGFKKKSREIGRWIPADLTLSAPVHTLERRRM